MNWVRALAPRWTYITPSPELTGAPAWVLAVILAGCLLICLALALSLVGPDVGLRVAARMRRRGTWLEPARRPHRCRKPWLLPWRRVGLRWQCGGCEDRYQVAGVATRWWTTKWWVWEPSDDQSDQLRDE